MMMLLALLTASALPGQAYEGVCGNGDGQECRTDFSGYRCGSGELCGHDDFNAWCCPPGCYPTGSYQDPSYGDNQHCMTYEHMSSSCNCSGRVLANTAVSLLGGGRLQTVVAVGGVVALIVLVVVFVAACTRKRSAYEPVLAPIRN